MRDPHHRRPSGHEGQLAIVDRVNYGDYKGGADAAPSGHVAGTIPLHGHWRQRLMITVGAQAFACETLYCKGVFDYR